LIGTLIAVAVLFTGIMAFAKTAPTAQKQKTFSSPEEAVAALVAAARNNDNKELRAIFGPPIRTCFLRETLSQTNRDARGF